MRRKPIVIVGFLLAGLALSTILLRAIAAVRANEPFIGVSYYHLPIGTYSTLAVFAVVAAVGVVWLIRAVVRGARRR